MSHEWYSDHVEPNSFKQMHKTHGHDNRHRKIAQDGKTLRSIREIKQPNNLIRIEFTFLYRRTACDLLCLFFFVWQRQQKPHGE